MKTIDKKLFVKYSSRILSKTFDILNILGLLLFAVICLYPFYYLMIYSLSDPQITVSGEFLLLPKQFTFTNFIKIFSLNNIGSSALVSVTRTLTGTFMTVTACSFFAYLVTKPMYARKIIYRMLVITLYIDAGLIPFFLVMRQYGMINNPLIYVVPSLLSAYFTILIKTFIEQISPSLEESAMLDGAGVFSIFRNIILPLSKPILATIALFAAVDQWNAWFDAHIYISNRNWWPMQYILYRYLKEAQVLARRAELSPSSEMVAVQITPTAVRMTMTAVVTFPVLCVYPFMQRYFIKGIMIGAIKG